VNPLAPDPTLAPAPVLPAPPALAALVGAHVLDAELAALLWVLLDARTPVIVAGAAETGRRAVVDGLAAALPTDAVLLPVAHDDDFDWLPQAEALGWRRNAVAEAQPVADPRTGVLLAYDLADAAAGGPDGGPALIAVRALSLGYGMLATMPGDGLDDVLDRLRGPGIGTDEDERSRLGVVLVMDPPAAAHGPRIAAAHYLRPVALDTHGHVQRLAPAVLATWNLARDRWDHFAWGALDDLGGRTDRAPRDLEREQARRAAALASASSVAGDVRVQPAP
jgi:hypothetical protein